MYTEYVFENKSYEVALRDIKSILFDIVSQEEKNISALRERAFSNVSAVNAPAMQSLFVQQDERLRNVLGISEHLTRAIQEVDACSKQLRLIDQSTVQQVLASQQAQSVPKTQEAPTIQESVGNALQANATEEPVAEKAADAVAEEPVVVATVEEEKPAEVVAESVKEASAPTSMEDIADAMEVDEGDALSSEAEEAAQSGISTMTDDLIAAHSEEEAAPEEPAIIISEDAEIANPVIPVEQTAGKEKVAEGEQEKGQHESLIIKYNDEISTIKDEPTEAPAEEKAAEGEQEEGQHESLIIKYNDEISTIKDEPTEAPAEEKAAEGEQEEGQNESLIIKYNDEVSTIPDEPASEEEAEEEKAEATSEQPVLTPITESHPTEATSTEEATPVAAAPAAEATTTTDAIPDSFMFRKRNADAPRGIMISKDQASKLKGSLAVQTALLNAKGVLQSSYSGEKQLEAMMAEANDLYSQGKVAEAQDKIEEINAYTKGMTESVGIAA